jgi:hypothetical protein
MKKTKTFLHVHFVVSPPIPNELNCLFVTGVILSPTVYLTLLHTKFHTIFNSPVLFEISLPACTTVFVIEEWHLPCFGYSTIACLSNNLPLRLDLYYGFDNSLPL